MLQSNIEQFQNYSNFNSLKEFNNHIEAFLACHKNDFSKKELIAFKRLTKFAAKVYGVSNVSIKTLLKAINERSEGSSVSESTFHRMKRKAVKLGILSIIPTTRKNGSQSSNLWVFNRFLNKNDIPQESQKRYENQSKQGLSKDKKKQEMTSHKTSNNLKTSNILNNNIRIDDTFTEKTFVRKYLSYIPEDFFEVVYSRFPDIGTIKEYWKIVQIVAYKNLFCTDIVEHAVFSFNKTIYDYKTKNIKNPKGWFYGILNQRLERSALYNIFDDVFENEYDYHMNYDELEVVYHPNLFNKIKENLTKNAS